MSYTPVGGYIPRVKLTLEFKPDNEILLFIDKIAQEYNISRPKAVRLVIDSYKTIYEIAEQTRQTRTDSPTSGPI